MFRIMYRLFYVLWKMIIHFYTHCVRSVFDFSQVCQWVSNIKQNSVEHSKRKNRVEQSKRNSREEQSNIKQKKVE